MTDAEKKEWAAMEERLMPGSGKAETVAGEIIRAPKDEIILLSLEKFNALGGFKFESVCDLLKNPPALKAELKVRKKLAGAYSLSPIIVIEKGELKAGFKFEIECDSVVFADVRERVKKL